MEKEFLSAMLYSGHPQWSIHWPCSLKAPIKVEYIINCDWICKNRHNVTLGQLHFIGPAYSHTRTPPMHPCIGLSWLICFSGGGFVDHVVTTETMGLMEGTRWEVWVWYSPLCWQGVSWGTLGLSGPMTSSSWTHSYILQTVLLEDVTHLRLPTHPPLIHAIHDITVAVKKLLKILQC